MNILKLKYTLKDHNALIVHNYIRMGNYDDEEYIFINDMNINIQCNIEECFIDLIFFCDELNIQIENIEREFKPSQYNYLNQLHYILKDKLKNIFGKTSTKYSKLSKLDDPSIFIDPKIIDYDRQYLKTNYLKSIVKNHYNDILINFDSYILYCKTNKIKINLKKITERTNYIKEYVKKVYDITLV